MRIFGLNFPETFNIYEAQYNSKLDNKYPVNCLYEDHYLNYVVVFSGENQISEDTSLDVLNKLGRFEFDEVGQTLGFEKEGVVYEWSRSNGHESLKILGVAPYNIGDEISVCFNERKDGICTSDLSLYRKYSSPIIRSYISQVKVVGEYTDFAEEAPSEQYLEFFKQLLRNEHFNYVIPNSLKNEQIMDIIAQVFEYPISNLVSGIKDDDQSWRFDKEREEILSLCESAKRKARSKKEEVIAMANKEYKWALDTAEREKEEKLQELDGRAKAYSAPKVKPKQKSNY